ncbi:magnesium chelatase domain-containing protein [Nocardia sp. NBC_01388]|uniref:magnesium chelatase domain-containing protein n=1 Tax=Nocardia sp. NBC_01388 TaxID=2903596 RepID=UPI00324EC1DA
MTSVAHSAEPVPVWSICVGDNYSGTLLPVTAQLDTALEPATTGITREARDRVRAAICNAGHQFPDGRLVISAPVPAQCRADLSDLAVAVAIEATRGSIPARALADTVFIGQLGLDGRLSARIGLALAVRMVQQAGLSRVVVPAEHADRLSRTAGVEVFAASTLSAVLAWVSDPRQHLRAPVPQLRDRLGVPADVRVREAVQVCAAGGHHLAVTGTGNAPTLVPVHYLHALLPSLSRRVALGARKLRARTEVTCVSPLSLTPPLRELHHSASWRTVFGTADIVGAAARAHQGVLACREFPHWDSKLGRALATLTREGVVRFGDCGQLGVPAQFQLALTGHDCICEGTDRRSPPTAHVCFRWPHEDLDGCVDVRVRIQPGAVETVSRARLTGREQVCTARRIAARRWSRLGVLTNARVPVDALRGALGVRSALLRELDRLTQTGALTAAQAGAVLAVAWTLCDLRGATSPTADDLEYALRLRRPV